MHAPSLARLLGATFASAALAFACSATVPDAPGSSTDPIVADPGGGGSGGTTDPSPGGEACGDTTCGEGLVCCNASCGTCVPPGFMCTQEACAPAPDAAAPDASGPDASKPDAGGGEPCGETTCGEGLFCCNASCGICTPPDGACIQVLCQRTNAGDRAD